MERALVLKGPLAAFKWSLQRLPSVAPKKGLEMSLVGPFADHQDPKLHFRDGILSRHGTYCEGDHSRGSGGANRPHERKADVSGAAAAVQATRTT